MFSMQRRTGSITKRKHSYRLSNSGMMFLMYSFDVHPREELKPVATILIYFRMGRRKPRASQHHKPPHSHASNEAADPEKTQPSGQQLYGQPGPRSSRASKTGERQDGSGQRTRQQTSYNDTSNHSPQRGTPYHQHHRRGSRKSMHSNVRNRTYGNSQELTAAETVGRGKRHEGSSHSRPYQNQSLGGRGYHDNEQEEQTAQQARGHPRRHHDGSYYRCKKVHQQRSDQGAHRKSWTKTKCSRQDVSQPGGSTSTDESAASGAQDDLGINLCNIIV